MNVRIVAPAVLCLAASACAPRAAAPPSNAPNPDEPMMCTMEFRTYSTRVQTASGTPVADARIDVRRSDGASVVCTAEGQRGCVNVREFGDAAQPNAYTIMTDAVPVARGGENFTVNATANGKTVAGVFRFAHDGCHVRKVSGPDVLTIDN